MCRRGALFININGLTFDSSDVSEDKYEMEHVFRALW